VLFYYLLHSVEQVNKVGSFQQAVCSNNGFKAANCLLKTANYHFNGYNQCSRYPYKV